MRPTLRQMQYLIAVAETGRYGEAAKRVNVSQPSLSAQIADMETELGAPLLERGRQGARLTPVGEEIVRRARLILRDVEDLRACASRQSGNLAGRIRLGVLPSIGPYLLPPATRQLHAEHPDLRLVVREARTIDLGKDLEDGRADTVISTAEDHTQATSTTLFEEGFWVCAAHDDPILQGSGDVNITDLSGRPLLALGYGHRLTLAIEALASAAGAFVSSEYEGTSLDAVRQMAETGAGIAILPSLYAISEARRDPGIKLRRINHPIARRQISLVWRATSPLADMMLTLAASLRQAAAQILADEPRIRNS